jgi:hypothetical protein
VGNDAARPAVVQAEGELPSATSAFATGSVSLPISNLDAAIYDSPRKIA